MVARLRSLPTCTLGCKPDFLCCCMGWPWPGHTGWIDGCTFRASHLREHVNRSIRAVSGPVSRNGGDELEVKRAICRVIVDSCFLTFNIACKRYMYCLLSSAPQLLILL